jgi:hypothetical protein
MPAAACCVLCRYINAARDVNYAHSVLEMEGDALEHTRFWQYVMHNGKNALYKAYAVSLDLYVMFCWEQLGGLGSLLTGLLIAEVRGLGVRANCKLCMKQTGYSESQLAEARPAVST